MDKLDRFQLLHRQFRRHRKPIPIKKLAEKLECTEGTVKRIIDQMRLYFFGSNRNSKVVCKLSLYQ